MEDFCRQLGFLVILGAGATRNQTSKARTVELVEHVRLQRNLPYAVTLVIGRLSTLQFMLLKVEEQNEFLRNTF